MASKTLGTIDLNVSLHGNFAYGRMIKDEYLIMLLQAELSERDLQLILNCMDYAAAEHQGGLPGHNLMLVIAKLLNVMQLDKDLVSKALNEISDEEQESYDDDESCLYGDDSRGFYHGRPCVEVEGCGCNW